MIDDADYMVENIFNSELKKAQARRFPVLAQLSLLGLVLAIIFSISFIPRFFTENTTALKNPALESQLAAADIAVPNIEKIENVMITGKAAFVYDVKGKKALYIKDADTTLPLASITKLMTALVAYELIDSQKAVSIPASAVSQYGFSGLIEGEVLTAKSLSDLALLASSNDAAFALAAAVGAVINPKNPNQTFVNAMNIKAEELGLNSLLFYNPTGLDIDKSQAGAFGTARDVSFLMEYILEKYPNILEPSTFTTTKVYNNAGSYHAAENTNSIVTQIPNLLGSKTGFTDLAGGNLTVAFDAGFNRPIIVTVLGSSYDGRFSDVKKLVSAVTSSLNTTE